MTGITERKDSIGNTNHVCAATQPTDNEMEAQVDKLVKKLQGQFSRSKKYINLC